MAPLFFTGALFVYSALAYWLAIRWIDRHGSWHEDAAMTPADADDLLARDERTALDIYARVVRPAVGPGDDGKYVAVAVESEDFEIDADDYRATDRLLARRPGARVWLMRVGPAAAYRMAGAGREPGA